MKERAKKSKEMEEEVLKRVGAIVPITVKQNLRRYWWLALPYAVAFVLEMLGISRAGWPWWIGVGLGIALGFIILGVVWGLKSSELRRKAWETEIVDKDLQLTQWLRDFSTVDVVWTAACFALAGLVISLVGVLYALIIA